MDVQTIVDGIAKYLPDDGTADYITTIEVLGITGDIAGFIVGLLVAVLIAGLPIVVTLEMCYINFPIIQNGCENLYNRLRGKANRIFGLAIRDARKAVELSHTEEYGVSANWIYLKIKIKAVFLAVFIVAMVLGPGQFLLKMAWNLIQGIVGYFV